MATRKLSQIAASGSNFTSSDFIVAVQAGTTDVRYTNAQMFGAITAATITQSNAPNTSADGLVLVNTATASSGNQEYSPSIRLTGQGWKTDAGGASQQVDLLIENIPAQGASTPSALFSLKRQINLSGYNTVFYISTDPASTISSLVAGSGQANLVLNVNNTNLASYYADTSQVIIGSMANVPLNFYTNSVIHFSIAVSGVMSGTFALGANTSGEGFVLTNNTAASAGNQQYSPQIRLTGQGWKTDATAASEQVDWTIENVPIEGTAHPSGRLNFKTQVASGGYTTPVYFENISTQAVLVLSHTSAAGINVIVSGNTNAVVYADTTQAIFGSNGNLTVKYYTNATTRMYNPGAGGLVVGSGAAAIATNATDGFLYIPSCAGTPTGTPTVQTGSVAMVYDTTNNKLYIYNGAWKGGTAPGAWS